MLSIRITTCFPFLRFLAARLGLAADPSEPQRAQALGARRSGGGGGDGFSGKTVVEKQHFFASIFFVLVEMYLLYGLRPAPAMPGQRRVKNKNFIVACEVPGNASRGSEEASRPSIHEAHFEPFWGHVEGLTLETLSPVASEVRSIFSPKL